MQTVVACFAALAMMLFLFIRSQFWMRQPTRHFYDCAQLDIKPKKWTKYCDARITTFKYADQPVDALIAFIQKNVEGYLNASHVRAYLHHSNISVLAEEEIVGALVSRPVHFLLDKVEQPAEVHEYFVGPQSLLCTHEHNRPPTPGFFTRMTPIPMLVPMVKYPIFWVETSRYRQHKVQVTKITASTILTLRHRLVTSTFRCRVVPSIELFLHLIENKAISVYCTPQTTLIFKNTMNVEKNRSVLDLVAVIGDSDKAYGAFSSLVYQCRATYGWVRIHGISDYVAVNRKPPSKTTMRYVYGYNYYAPRVKPEDCLMV